MKLSKKTQERLANLISQAMLFGRANNDFDTQMSAHAIVLLNLNFGIRLPSLQRAREVLADLQQQTTERNRNEATQLRG